jgi:hypothetical protein
MASFFTRSEPNREGLALDERRAEEIALCTEK